LAVVFDWLEQPPFTLAVMIITGLALRDGNTVDPEPPVAVASSAQPAAESR